MLEYLRITSSESLANLNHLKPFKAVVIIETPLSGNQQEKVSKWLAKSGCLYMMAWGYECSSWDTSVDIANHEEFDNSEIPDDSFIMTTWHENEPMKEVFFYSKHAAFHPTVELENVLILHIGETDKEEQFREQYLASSNAE